MRWFTWLMPVLAVTTLILGFAINLKDRFQVSTGWVGFFVFLAAFFILMGVERIVEDASQ
jgi:hypothetical protein